MEEPRDPDAGDDIDERERDEAELVEAAPDAMFSSSAGTGFRGLANRTDSYGFVLLLLAVLIWVFTPLAVSKEWAIIPTVIAYALSVGIALHTSFVPRPRVHLALVAVAVLVAASIVGVGIDNTPMRVVGNLGFAVMLVVTGFAVFARLMRHRTVTTRTVSGAVAVYLLIALAFSEAFSAVEIWHPGSFTNMSGRGDFGSLQYFSFVTIATLGYGDITPVSSVARSLATLEAIGGQIFLVTVVARLVSMFRGKAESSSTDGSQRRGGDPGG